MAYSSSEKAVLRTILYSDIFNFPLTKKELWNFLISSSKIDENSFEKAVNSLGVQVIRQKDGFYCLKDKEQIIARRKKNLTEMKKKLRLAKKAAYYLSHIPTVYFIGISGGVAVGNVASKDDVDLFIIAKKNTLFTTRLWILALLELFNLRRKRGEGAHASADKICVNLLIDESSLRWPKNKQDIYTAHEIVRVRPLFERKGMYRKFLDANLWVNNVFPNNKIPLVLHEWKAHYYTISVIGSIFTLAPFEKFSRELQKIFIKRHLTNETVTNSLLAFHPHDYRREILTLLKKNLQSFRLLTNV